MQGIQKQTYLKLIMSKIYSEDAFCAKSITLDFMYQFDNPCIAMLSLTKILNYDNCIAKVSLKCIFGIVLAVEDYFKYNQKVIMSKFTNTLIDGVVYRIDDTFIEDYEDYMIKIIQFITQNVDFNLLYSYFELIRPFKFSNLENSKNKSVYEAFCQNIRQVCNRMLIENEKLFYYKLNIIKSRYEFFRNDENMKEFIKVIDEVCDKIIDQVYIFSNNSNIFAGIETQLRKDLGENIHNLEKDEVDKIINEKYKVIFILDFQKDDFNEMLYYLGKLEAKLRSNNMFLAIFYGCSASHVKGNPAIKRLIDRYIQGENAEIVYGKILDFIKDGAFQKCVNLQTGVR